MSQDSCHKCVCKHCGHQQGGSALIATKYWEPKIVQFRILLDIQIQLGMFITHSSILTRSFSENESDSIFASPLTEYYCLLFYGCFFSSTVCLCNFLRVCTRACCFQKEFSDWLTGGFLRCVGTYQEAPQDAIKT